MSDSRPHPTHFPPPWNLTGEVYIIVTSSPNKLNDSLSGVYHPLEAQSDFANEEKSGKFRGGVTMGFGFVQIIRYHTSPVGPYDELLYIPGQFETPGGNSHLRITNIYLSSEASVYNGRYNWNIPKHLATFSFTELSQQEDRPAGPKRVHIKVSQPHTEGSKPNPPFFSAICTLNPFRYLPSFPFNSEYIPFMESMFTQPPLPGLQDSVIEISTNQWRTFKSTMKGKATLMTVQPANNTDEEESIKHGEFADGVYFSKIKPVAGAYLKKMDLSVLEPIEDAKPGKTKRKT